MKNLLSILNKFHSIFLLFLLIIILSLSSLPAQTSFSTKDYKVKVVKLFKGLSYPWGFDFLPDGRIILTEKGGKVLILNLATKKVSTAAVLRQVADLGQGGLLDVLVDPNFSNEKPFIYLTLSTRQRNQFGTILMKADLIKDELTNFKVLFRAEPLSTSGIHFGSRVRIDQQGFIYLSLGERGNRSQSQDLASHYGKIIRLTRDGGVPEDNPFSRQFPEFKENFTYGHRNPQGMAIHPSTGEIWTSEHGARGGDEINIIKAGRNYGWPIISYGTHYSGRKIGEGTRKSGMEQPIHYWDPSIAPAGMTFYEGELFPKWKNNLFVSSLKFGLISRLKIVNNRVVEEERIFRNNFGRIRDIKQSPRGSIMFITDERNGGLYEISL